jgi:hypothetical protein
MNISKGITKIMLSPVKGVSEVVDDFNEENSEGEKFLSLSTLGVSSLIKGTLKGIKEGAEEIYED